MTVGEPAPGIRRGVTAAAQPALAAAELYDSLQQSDLGFAAFFCSSRYDLPRLASEMRRRFGDCPMVGCTTAGEIGPRGYSEGGIAGFSIARNDCVAVSARIERISQLESPRGMEAAKKLIENLEMRDIDVNPSNTFAFLMIDALSYNEERVSASVSAGLGNIPLFGGSAGDDYKVQATHVYHDGRFHTDAAILTLVHTEHPFRVISTHHFQGGDSELIVTGADPQQRLVTEINGEPAAREYARHLGVDLDYLKREMHVYPPLMVRIGGTYYARGINLINDDDSLKFACAIDEGVPLSMGRNTGIVPNLEKMFSDLQAEIGTPVLVIGFDCLMRKLEANHEGGAERIGQLFRDNNVIGMSGYGEQIKSMHVNQTFTGVAIGSADSNTRYKEPPLSVHEQLLEVERENAKFRKTVEVLRSRIERSFDLQGDNFSLFQNAILLEETVRRRTEELEQVNQQLAHELTVRREMEEELRNAKQQADEANQSKTHLLAGVSHDLQQPLNAARLLLGALAEDRLSDSNRDLCTRIEAAIGTAEDMLVSFLDISKLDSGIVVPKHQHFRVGPLLAQLASEYAPQAQRRGVEVRMVPGSAVVCTDRSLLHRVLRNLLSNAVRYTHRGKVLLGCRRVSGAARIEVWDTGIGIPQDRLGEVFQPFHRLAERQFEGHRGAGLGLSIVERICHLLDLAIEVDSEEGKGSGFRVTVPFGNEQAIEAPRLAEDASFADVALQGRRVVVIDDDSHALEGMAALLGAWESEPLLATAVDEAIAMLESTGRAADLAIIDYHLGDGVEGLAAAARLRAALPGKLPIIVVSGDRRAETKRQIREAGYAFLNKPLDPSRLRAMVAFELSDSCAGEVATS